MASSLTISYSLAIYSIKLPVIPSLAWIKVAIPFSVTVNLETINSRCLKTPLLC